MPSTIVTALLTGTIGVGKTSLAEAMSEELHARGIRHALVDLDWLGQVYPRPDAQDPFNMNLQLDNLAAIWPRFLAARISHALVAGTLDARWQLQGVSKALPQAEITVVRVTAPPEVIKGRLRARGKGSLLDDFLARTDQVAADIEAAGIENLTVSNDGPNLSELAVLTLDRLGWLGHPDR